MDLFKVYLDTTNNFKDHAWDKKHNIYTEVNNGYIYVKANDLEYILDNYKLKTADNVGFLFERPLELDESDEESEVDSIEQNINIIE